MRRINYAEGEYKIRRKEKKKYSKTKRFYLYLHTRSTALGPERGQPPPNVVGSALEGVAPAVKGHGSQRGVARIRLAIVVDQILQPYTLGMALVADVLGADRPVGELFESGNYRRRRRRRRG